MLNLDRRLQRVARYVTITSVKIKHKGLRALHERDLDAFTR